tara:strand:- start:5363 stop:5785 length:423 start_codon:yes stop_codon:yes gene_type:complete
MKALIVSIVITLSLGTDLAAQYTTNSSSFLLRRNLDISQVCLALAYYDLGLTISGSPFKTLSKEMQEKVWDAQNKHATAYFQIAHLLLQEETNMIVLKYLMETTEVTVGEELTVKNYREIITKYINQVELPKQEEWLKDQ